MSDWFDDLFENGEVLLEVIMAILEHPELQLQFSTWAVPAELFFWWEHTNMEQYIFGMEIDQFGGIVDGHDGHENDVYEDDDNEDMAEEEDEEE